MADSIQYQTYYAMDLDHIGESWGGNTYTKILAKEYPDEALKSTASTQSNDVTFLYQTAFKNVYYLNGVAEGHITLQNCHAADTATITTYTVTLQKTKNVAGGLSTVASYTRSISANNTIAATGAELRLPVYMDISKQTISDDNKLLLKITYESTDGTVYVKHELDSNDPDIKLKIPYQPPGA